METFLIDSWWGQLFGAYLAGLATVLTPCIYPLLPITVSLLGVTSTLSRWKAFLLSGSYVLGIAGMYTALGWFAGVVLVPKQLVSSEWLTSLDKALEVAKAGEHVVVLDVYADCVQPVKSLMRKHSHIQMLRQRLVML
jgi:cytochrome c biogenesis protein CcdA